MTVPRRKRDPGLPSYLPCPACNGTGYVSGTVHSPRCECGGKGGNCPGGREETELCGNRLCFDGDLICWTCSAMGKLPRVENPGPDYIVPILAVAMDGDIGLCAYHFTHCDKGHVFLQTEDGPICECDPSHPSHDEDRAERQYDRDVAAFYGASTPQTEAERYRAAAEEKRRLG